ncbi:MAG: hypothetical protein WC244_00445 [Patescibacteria group bacterium]|jgi:hypothetical protein
MEKDLYNLQNKLEQEKRPKRKVKGTGFAKQRQVMEQSGYYIKTKKKKEIKLIDKRKK